MIKFSIVAQSKKSQARLGLLETAHGIIETPTLVPVATQASLKTLTSEEGIATNTQIIISNTFHLHLRPGEKIVATAGGLHSFMQWPRPIMTDSGGFQVFSLGFGRDFQVGKVMPSIAGKPAIQLSSTAQPQSVQIMADGVFFHSPIDGRKLFLGPQESIAIQQMLGADIIFAFDECTPPLASLEYASLSLERTHRWAHLSLESRTSGQALFGIVQGSHYQHLREMSARYINSLGFDGFGIGGDLGQTKQDSDNILQWTIPYLDRQKPRHLLGIGRLEDIERIIRQGVDLFDCTVPTHYARRGVAFTSQGKLSLSRPLFLDDASTLDPQCACQVCSTYSRRYISHLVRAREITAMRLLTFHNLFFFNAFVATVRDKIRREEL